MIKYKKKANIHNKKTRHEVIKMEFYTSKQLRPKGWLKRQLEIQAEGLSGNLDKIWPDVRDSMWIGGDREGWERVPYWLDGFVPLAYLLENEDMIARCKRYIDAIVAAQNEDGWICPCTKEQRAEYDTWALQLISKVLKVYYDCSGDERIPDVLYRAMKNYYELLSNGTIHLFRWGRYRWFEAIIAIDFLYERCHEEWLLELVKILREQGADYGTMIDLWKRPMNEWRLQTHIVNLTMMLKSEALVCKMLGESYTDKAEYFRELLDKYNGTVYESFTGDECLSGVSPVQGTELCAIVEQMYSYEILYAYTGDAKWAERLEVLAFNALPATISDDMWTHQYVQMSNQMECKKFPGKSFFRTNGPDAHLFGLEPNYGCCTANFNQGWPKFALSAFMHDGDTITNGILLPSVLECDEAKIELSTNYPFENSAKYVIDAKKDFTFKVRVPSFAKELIVNGKNESASLLSFDISQGKTEITLSFEATPYFRERPNDLFAVQCGSLIYSVPVEYEAKMYEEVNENVDKRFPYCDYELISTGDWAYGYSSKELHMSYNGVGEIPFSGKEPAVVIEAKVKNIDWGFADGYDSVCAKVPESTKPMSEEKSIKLCPYGCAKLRMTELPFVK